MSNTTQAKPAELLTTAELAQKYKVSHRTILNWESQGKISPAVREGRVLRWNAVDVARCLERQAAELSKHADELERYVAERETTNREDAE